AKTALLVQYPFCNHNGTQCESFSGMGCMFNFNVIYPGCILHNVRSGNLVDAERSDGDVVSVTTSQNPFLLAINVSQNSFRQRYRGATWSVLLFRVVYFVKADLVFRKRIHNPREIFVDLEEDVYTEAKVRCVKEGAIPF